MVGGLVGRLVEGERGSCCKVLVEVRGKIVVERGVGKMEEREGLGEDWCCKRRF